MKVIDKDGNIVDWPDPPDVKLSAETIEKALEFGKTFREKKMTTTTWRQEIIEEMEARGDSWNNVVATTLSDAELDKEIPLESPNKILPDLPSYTWTETRVYFVTVEECWSWITSVPRQPCDCKPENH